MPSDRPGPVLRRLLKAPAWLYRMRLGWLLGSRFLLITHVGRRSGREYRTVVEVVGRLPVSGEYVVMAGFGHTADWLQNLRAGGGREVTVGRRRFRPAVRELDEDEGSAVLAGYERRNRLIAPVVRRVLSRLVGWRYTGTEDQRRRLVAERPLMALRPVDSAR
jgi:deazaflavin-dependent oxidoreductase (nitroreductase family)